MHQSFSTIEKMLSQRKYLCSDDQFSAADIVASQDITQLRYMLWFDEYIKKYPHVQSWYSKLMEIPEFKETNEVNFKLMKLSQ